MRIKSIYTFSQVVQNIFPSHEELVKSRLITRDELEMIESEGDIEKLWWIPLSWSMNLINM